MKLIKWKSTSENFPIKEKTKQSKATAKDCESDSYPAFGNKK